jgi:hypothetical protein
MILKLRRIRPMMMLEAETKTLKKKCEHETLEGTFSIHEVDRLTVESAPAHATENGAESHELETC